MTATSSLSEIVRPYLVPMKIDVVQTQARVPVTIIRLTERINLGNAGQLEEKAREIFSKGTRYLLIDLTHVPSMSSAGLRSLKIIHKMFMDGSFPGSDKIAADGGMHAHHSSPYLKLLNPNAELRRTLQISGFDAYFDIYDSEQEALLAF